MKNNVLLVIVCALIFWIGMPVEATSDPVQLITAGLTLIGVPHPIATVIAVAVVVGATKLLGTKQNGDKTTGNPGAYKGEWNESMSSAMFAVGRCVVGGVQAFGNSYGSNRYRVYAHVQGPVDQIEEHFFNEKSIVLFEPGHADEGLVHTYPYRQAGVEYVEIQTKLGDGTETAYTDLVAAFPNHWTADHKGQGICQSMIRFNSGGIYSGEHGKMYSGGLPEYNILLRGALFYDPRDGAQNVDDATTYKWTENAILVCAGILQMFPNITNDMIDWSDSTHGILAHANTADTYGYILAGVFPLENKRQDVMEDMLNSCGAEIYVTPNQKYSIRIIEDNRASEFEFEKGDIIRIERDSGPQGIERPNRARITYYSPERFYAEADLDLLQVPWAYITDEISEVGESVVDIEHPFCPNYIQAQRVGRRRFMEARAPRGTLVTNMVGLIMWGRHTFSFRDSDANQMIRAEVLSVRENTKEGAVEIEFFEQPHLNPWSITPKAGAATATPDYGHPSTIAKPDAPVKIYSVQDSNGNYQLRVSVDSSGVFAGYGGFNNDLEECVYRLYNSDGNPGQMVLMKGTGNADEGSTDLHFWYYDWSDGSLEGSKFDTRYRGRDVANEQYSQWSDYLEVASLGKYSGPAVTSPAFAPVLVLTVVDYTAASPTQNLYDFDLSWTNFPINVAKIEIEEKVDTGSWGVIETINMKLPYTTDATTINKSKQSGAAHTYYYRAVYYYDDGTSPAPAKGSYSNEESYTVPAL